FPLGFVTRCGVGVTFFYYSRADFMGGDAEASVGTDHQVCSKGFMLAVGILAHDAGDFPAAVTQEISHAEALAQRDIRRMGFHLAPHGMVEVGAFESTQVITFELQSA